jgi:hypothetical protein
VNETRYGLVVKALVGLELCLYLSCIARVSIGELLLAVCCLCLGIDV